MFSRSYFQSRSGQQPGDVEPAEVAARGQSGAAAEQSHADPRPEPGRLQPDPAARCRGSSDVHEPVPGQYQPVWIR